MTTMRLSSTEDSAPPCCDPPCSFSTLETPALSRVSYRFQKGIDFSCLTSSLQESSNFQVLYTQNQKIKGFFHRTSQIKIYLHSGNISNLVWCMLWICDLLQWKITNFFNVCIRFMNETDVNLAFFFKGDFLE